MSSGLPPRRYLFPYPVGMLGDSTAVGSSYTTNAGHPGEKISLTPKLGVLNIWDATDLTDIEQKWAALGYLLTKRAIAIHWGLTRRPPVIEWVAAMDKCMTAEKEVYKTRGCPKKWDKKWGKWNAYRGEICTSPTADTAMMQRGKSNTTIMSE